jgi:hypothetical protein
MSFDFVPENSRASRMTSSSDNDNNVCSGGRRLGSNTRYDLGGSSDVVDNAFGQLAHFSQIRLGVTEQRTPTSR